MIDGGTLSGVELADNNLKPIYEIWVTDLIASYRSSHLPPPEDGSEPNR